MQDYIVTNKIDTKQFTDKMPGYTWMKNFMKRNRLPCKKTEMIGAKCKSNMSNPFIIYDFYEQLEKVCNMI